MSTTLNPNPRVIFLSPLVKALCAYRVFPLPHQLILAQIDQESGGDETIETRGTVPCAENNGTGYGQIEGYYNWEALKFTNCMDCHNALLNGPYNLDKLITFMRDLHAKYGDYNQALQAYNTGQPTPAPGPYSEAVMAKYDQIYWNVP